MDRVGEDKERRADAGEKYLGEKVSMMGRKVGD